MTQPLEFVTGGLQLLERTSGRLPSPRVFESMRRAIARGTGLTRHLLAFSRRRPINPESIDPVAHLTGIAMPDGGVITIAVENVHVMGDGGGDFVKISVADTGVGMAPHGTSTKDRDWGCRRCTVSHNSRAAA